ncbi:MAG: hypothetical protein WA990_11165 [Rubrobacteraceae bacterium]
MDLGITMLLAAFAGGLFGAAIGGLPAFIFTGFVVLAGAAAAASGSDFDFINDIAFGPVFGPHISFAGGAAAAAFAARRGELEDGKDIAAPMTGVNDPLALVVGGLFGVGGLIVNQLIALVTPLGQSGFFYGTYTDTVALTVFISGIVARVMFGRTGIFGSLDPEARARGRFVPEGEAVWLDYQQGFLQSVVLGLGTGLLSAYIVVAFSNAGSEAIAAAAVLGWGISAASLILLQIGFSCPVTHHMTLPAGVAATAILLAFGGSPAIAMIAGAVAGIGGALLGELFSRLFLIHGDTHVDPPAAAIAAMGTIIIVVSLPFV